MEYFANLTIFAALNWVCYNPFASHMCQQQYVNPYWFYIDKWGCETIDIHPRSKVWKQSDPLILGTIDYGAGGTKWVKFIVKNASHSQYFMGKFWHLHFYDHHWYGPLSPTPEGNFLTIQTNKTCNPTSQYQNPMIPTSGLQTFPHQAQSIPQRLITKSNKLSGSSYSPKLMNSRRS